MTTVEFGLWVTWALACISKWCWNDAGADAGLPSEVEPGLSAQVTKKSTTPLGFTSSRSPPVCPVGACGCSCGLSYWAEFFLGSNFWC
jgi:hypothetical protein